MIPITDVTGLSGSVVAAAAAASRLPGVAGLARPRLALLLCAVAVLLLMPFGGMPAAGYLRGIVGDLSIPAVLLLVRAVARPFLGEPPADDGSVRALRAAIACAALALYPFALGIGPFDPYRLGYGAPAFVGAVLLAAAAGAVLGRTMFAACLSLAVLAWASGWYESGNLWDYLVDPPVAVWAIGGIVLRGVTAKR